MALRKTTTRAAVLASRYQTRGRKTGATSDAQNGPLAAENLTKGCSNPSKSPRKPSNKKSSPAAGTDEVPSRKRSSVKIEEDEACGSPKTLKSDDSPSTVISGCKQEPLDLKEEPITSKDDCASWSPANWMRIVENIRKMRKDVPAPVDTMGCDMCHDKEESPAIQRYQILVSLMLSSQTKDQVTFAAMGRLRGHGLTPENMIATDESVLQELIKPVGFYKRKAIYIKKASQILLDSFGGDIPESVEELCKLPGVGPKMAHICMNSAWNVVSGIGVDTHVHRISQRLGWLPPDVIRKRKKLENLTPEDTRIALESWLPRDLWSEVNHLLVGFGQTICKPVGPMCSECLNCSICPASKIKW
ncbi:endonuclease [Nesidiocoris tenuis]|uniref:Endonuclease III homolog n=1 Tax=Nesidiocoris tenuis TaxID=355587 RepID=A0ABN7B009_9HEMI|nr:endonuclease [Nesidiocoris tenuis]